ncbi:MAG: beta-phosphoglucomutase [Ruthenibacterium sp.]
MAIYEAIIFDLDGVICHTDKFHYNAWKKLADELKIVFNTEINHRLRGVSRMESLEIILSGSETTYSQEEKEHFATQKNEIYVQSLRQLSPKDLSGEVADTLNALRNSKIKLGIGSSSKNAKLILTRLGLGDYFDAVADGTQIQHSKPNPEVFLLCAKKLCTEPCNCLVVEDAAAGIAAAKAGGMAAAAIGDAFSCKDADYKLSCFSQLLTILEIAKNN